MVSVFGLARKSLARLAFALSVAALAACTPSAPGGPRIDTSQAVPVALLVPSGSGQAGDEVLARSLQNAARLAIADLGGVKIDLRVYPTAGLPEQAQAMAQKAVAEGAKIILGPVFAQEANAAGLAVAGRGINVLSFSNNTDVAGGNVFVLGPTFQNTANRLASYAVRNGNRKIMVAYDQNPAGEAGRAAIQAAVARAGGTLVGDSGYEFSQNGIVNAVPGITKTARESGAQAMFLTANTAGALPLLTQLLRDNGLDPAATRFIGLTRWDIPPGTVALPGVHGGWFALPDPALYAQYQARYQAAYGEPPHPISGLAYDGIAAIGALIKRGDAGALTTAGLTQGSGFVGVNGIFRLLPDGTNERGLAVAQISDNQLAVIDPAPRAFGGAGF
ncbi:MAG: penicillin-binding protein activator [Pseudorhodobacter sp.]|nr:penicillin-binding protein activator [Pseudorhodobacter sp.]